MKRIRNINQRLTFEDSKKVGEDHTRILFDGRDIGWLTLTKDAKYMIGFYVQTEGIQQIFPDQSTWAHLTQCFDSCEEKIEARQLIVFAICTYYFCNPDEYVWSKK